VRTLILFPILGLGVLGLTTAALPAGGGVAEKVKVQQQWKGGSSDKKDNNLWQAAPRGGVIAGPKAWAKLWGAWHAGQKPPAVDFTKELILVAAGPGPNIIHIEELTLKELTLNQGGHLRFSWSITELDGPGFVYTILKVNRAGIRTVNGKALPGDQAGILPGDYLTAVGRLKERLEVRFVQSADGGFRGGYWAIEPDGSWSTGRIMPPGKGGKAAPSATGKLTVAQLATLAKALALHDLAGLESYARPTVHGGILTIQFGKRSVQLYITERNRAIRERFEGIEDAVRALCKAG
jgi:hypothetical protein